MVAVDVEDEAVLGVIYVRIWTRPAKPSTATGRRTIVADEDLIRAGRSYLPDA
jgi:hypothetical protein